MTEELSIDQREARTRSRRKLFYLLLGLLGFWVFMMVATYYTTVYPRTHGHRASGTAVESVAPGLPVAPAARP